MKVIFTTVTPDKASAIVKELLENRLIGCGNIIPKARSFYWWKGNIQDDEEAVIFMETTDELISEAIEHLNKIHPYDVPKILSWEPSDAIPAYVQWLNSETINR